MRGKVYLVGAGPGDPGLITRKGFEAIQKADVIIYDRLANPILLDEAKEGVELIYVGKSGSHHTRTQMEINQLLVEKAQENKVVTRLKGGDPFIFGRGGEEIEELVEAGIPFEVVPGITSAIAVPAYAGIPLTHRELTSMVSFITGHEDPTKEESALDWAELAKAKGTLVFLMGVGNLSNIVANLTKFGRSPETPVALIQWGTRPEQRTVTGTLATIVEVVHKAGIRPPAIMVVGDVVQLREQMNWFEKKPLFGKRVLVTRSRDQASKLSKQLLDLGAEVLECPTIEIVPPQDWQPLDEKIQQLGDYDWVVFTSVNGVEYFIQRLFDQDLDVRSLVGAKLAAIGSATADRLRNYGLRVDFVPENYIAESLIEGLTERADLTGQKILLPRAQEAREILVTGLQDAGAEVDEVAAYQTVLGEGMVDLVELLNEDQVQVATFTSSSTARNLAEMLEPTTFGEMLKNVTVACIGPITAETVDELGGRVDLIAKEHTITGLVEALQNHFKNK